MNNFDDPNVKPAQAKTSETNAVNASLAPGLYIVPTPIGNLRDITLRALDVLGGCTRIYAEDTRVTAKLLQAFGLSKPIMRYDEHTHDKVAASVIAGIQQGEKLVLVSDAGTPAISDPGQYLVQACRAAHVPVVALPGASAVVTALSGAGLPTKSFCFVGFLPTKSKARQDMLRDYAERTDTLVLFESAARIADTVDDIALVMGSDRMIAVARELTKKFEEYIIGTAQHVQEKIAAHETLKGEIVLLIHGGDASKTDETDVESLLRDALAHHSVRDAVELVAKATGLKKQHVYQQALALSHALDDAE
jgi:16S rRNA (cytidine1402-2'-O)-methyltransferase